MLAASLIDSEDKVSLEMKMYTLTEEEALQEIDKLRDVQPIPGFHTIAHGMEEINRAARFAADKDDFYDRSKRTT